MTASSGCASAATAGRRSATARSGSAGASVSPAAACSPSVDRPAARPDGAGLNLQLGITDSGNAPKSTTSRQAYDLITAGFGPGSNGPLLVTADLGPGHGDRRRRPAAR